MKIAQTYSHLNGLEYLLVHNQELWLEIGRVINSVDANACKTKLSQEKTMRGKVLYSPIDMNRAFNKLLTARGWAESRVSYWVTKSERLIRHSERARRSGGATGSTRHRTVAKARSQSIAASRSPPP